MKIGDLVEVTVVGRIAHIDEHGGCLVTIHAVDVPVLQSQVRLLIDENQVKENAGRTIEVVPNSLLPPHTICAVDQNLKGYVFTLDQKPRGYRLKMVGWRHRYVCRADLDQALQELEVEEIEWPIQSTDPDRYSCCICGNDF